MKVSSLREQKDDELRQTHADSLKHLAELRIKKSKGETSEQPLLIRSVRRDVARIKTVMRERGLTE